MRLSFGIRRTLRRRGLWAAVAAAGTAVSGVSAQQPGLGEAYLQPPQQVMLPQFQTELPSDDALRVHEAGLLENADDKKKPKTVEDRLKAIEKDLEKAVADAKKKKDDDAKKPTLKLAGRLHLDGWFFPESDPLINVIERQSLTESPEDRVQFRRARLQVEGDIPNNMLYRMEWEFAAGVSQYRDMYLGFKELPYLQTVLIGNQKRPFNLDQLNSSRYNVFIERPFIGGAFDDEARRIGIQSYGVSEDEAYNWRFGAFMSQLAQGNAGPIGDPLQGEIGARFANTIWYDESSDGRGYAHWAVSGMYTDSARANGTGINGTGQHTSTARFFSRPSARSTTFWLDTGTIVGNDDYAQLGLESVVNVGRFQAVSEWSATSVDMLPGQGANKFFHGYYGYVSYFLTGEHIPWERKSGTIGRVKPFENFFLVNTCRDTIDGGWGAWQVAARYDYCDLNDQGVNGGIGSAVTLGLNWHWNTHAKWQFNYIRGRIENRGGSSFNGAQNALDPIPNAGDYSIIGTRFLVDF